MKGSFCALPLTWANLPKDQPVPVVELVAVGACRGLLGAVPALMINKRQWQSKDMAAHAAAEEHRFKAGRQGMPSRTETAEHWQGRRMCCPGTTKGPA